MRRNEPARVYDLRGFVRGAARHRPRLHFAAARIERTSPLAIADRRYSDSLRFASAIARNGGEAIEIGSDIGTVWFGDIEPRLRHSGLRLAGVTLPSDLFVLEHLADRSRSATVYTGTHRLARPLLPTSANWRYLARQARIGASEAEDWIGRLRLAMPSSRSGCKRRALRRDTSPLGSRRRPTTRNI